MPFTHLLHDELEKRHPDRSMFPRIIICCLILLHLEKACTSVSPFIVTGSVTVDKFDSNGKTDPWSNLLGSYVYPRSITDFHFNIFFNGTENVDAIDIIINGTSMVFAHSQQSVYISTKLGQIQGGKAKFQAFLSNPVFDADKRTATAKLSNRGNTVESIYGNISMLLDDDIRKVGQVRCQVTIIPYSLAGDTMNGYVLLSEALMRPPPELHALHRSSKEVKMKETAVFTANISFSSIEIKNSYAKVYFPTTNHTYQNPEREVKMSLLNFQVENVYGLDPVTSDSLRSLRSYDFSFTGTSEKECSILNLPPITLHPVSSAGTITLEFKAEGRLQDFKYFKDKEHLPVYMTFKSNDDEIWVTKTDVNVVDDLNDKEKIPVLKMDLAEKSREQLDLGLTEIRLRMTLEHAPESNGTAYNVTANVYLPPKVNITATGKIAYDVIKPFQITDSNGVSCTTDRVCHFDIPRLSFPHISRFYFNVTLASDTDKEEFDLVHEIVYNGWRSSKDLSSIPEISKLYGTEKQTDPDYEIEQKCTCLNDTSQSTCACCPSGSCQCVMTNPLQCSACDSPWHCIPTIQGYGKTSTVKDRYGNTLTCKDRRHLNPGRPWITCFKNLNSPKVSGLSPLVGTILGIMRDKDEIYGISNNGRGYVKSADGGSTWKSIPRETYTSASRSLSFLYATMI